MENGHLVTISYRKLITFRHLFGPPFTMQKSDKSPFPHTNAGGASRSWTSRSRRSTSTTATARTWCRTSSPAASCARRRGTPPQRHTVDRCLYTRTGAGFWYRYSWTSIIQAGSPSAEAQPWSMVWEVGAPDARLAATLIGRKALPNQALGGLADAPGWPADARRPRSSSTTLSTTTSTTRTRRGWRS